MGSLFDSSKEENNCQVCEGALTSPHLNVYTIDFPFFSCVLSRCCVSVSPLKSFQGESPCLSFSQHIFHLFFHHFFFITPGYACWKCSFQTTFILILLSKNYTQGSNLSPLFEVGGHFINQLL